MAAMVRFKMKMLVMLMLGVLTTLLTMMYLTTIADFYNLTYQEKNRPFQKYSIQKLQSIQNQSEYLEINPGLVSLTSEIITHDNNSYLERRQVVREACTNYSGHDQVLRVKRSKLDHILIDEKHKVLFCYVPKVACTNWKRIFMVLTGKANNITDAMNLPSYEVHARNLFASLQNYSKPEVEEMIRSYTKLMFVRNPLERLLSAYRNKLEQHYNSSKYFQSRFGKLIVKNFRKNPSNMSLEKGDDVTFSEFVQYLITSDVASYNEHWARITDLCHPCHIRYDLIGKYDTLMEDSDFVLDYLHLNFSFPSLPKPSRTAASLGLYFSKLDKVLIDKLYQIYQMDFKMFGYDLFATLGRVNN